MPLEMNQNVFITCAITGSGDTTSKSDKVPITPVEIADAAIAAAKAGAAVVHCHVRNPETGAPSRDPALFREVTDRIRSADIDMVLNLATERLAHIADCLPEICTLDCGTMNFGHGDYIMTNSPAMLREMAAQMRALGVKPEIEAFDTGHLWFAKKLVEDGLIEGPALVQLCMGIAWGAPDDLNTLMAMVNNLPKDWVFSAFSIGRNAAAYPAAAILAGGNIRVGLEDSIYLSRGVFATNAQLVERAATVATNMGASLIGPEAVRQQLGLVKQAPKPR